MWLGFLVKKVEVIYEQKNELNTKFDIWSDELINTENERVKERALERRDYGIEKRESLLTSVRSRRPVEGGGYGLSHIVNITILHWSKLHCNDNHFPEIIAFRQHRERGIIAFFFQHKSRSFVLWGFSVFTFSFKVHTHTHQPGFCSSPFITVVSACVLRCYAMLPFSFLFYFYGLILP